MKRGADCRFDGELTIDNDVLITGRINGKVRISGELELPRSAHVTGMMILGRLRLAGRVEADVIASESVELSPIAKLSGRLYTPKLIMAKGAMFHGEAHVGRGSSETAKRFLEQCDNTENAHRFVENLGSNSDGPFNATDSQSQQAASNVMPRASKISPEAVRPPIVAAELLDESRESDPKVGTIPAVLRRKPVPTHVNTASAGHRVSESLPSTPFRFSDTAERVPL